MKNVFILSLLAIIFISCKKDIKNVHKNFQTEDDEEWVLTNYKLGKRNGEIINGFGTHIKEFKFELPRLASPAKSGQITKFRNGSGFNENYMSLLGYLNGSELLKFDISFVVDDQKGANTGRIMYLVINKDSLVDGRFQRVATYDDLFTLTKINKKEMQFQALLTEGSYSDEYFYFEKRKK